MVARFLSDAARTAVRSEIREILKVIGRPGVISLAGGLPAPEAFPAGELAELLPAVLRRQGPVALQYGLTEGDAELRHELVRLMAEDGVHGLSPEHVLVTSASQQGLDLCSRVFLAPGDTVICGLPTYLGALGAFAACSARMCGVALDRDGLRLDLLEERLVDLRRTGVRPKLLYVVPDFENPSGVTLARERRSDLLQMAEEFDLLVLEDSPYRQLRYMGQDLPSLLELDRSGRVISLRTFSKILAPGLRLGWIVADPHVVSRLVVAKQAADLCTSPFVQVLVREFLKAGRLPGLIQRNRELYADRRLALLSALESHMDPAWGVRWTRPEGGLFVWVTLPVWLDAAELFQRAIAENVAFVVGRAFHCDGSGHNTLRLNFSHPSVEQIQQAVERLARAVGTLVRGGPAGAAGGAAAAPVVGDDALDALSWNLSVAETVS